MSLASAWMFAAAVTAAAMNVLIGVLLTVEPGVSLLAASFVRVLANGVLAAALLRRAPAQWACFAPRDPLVWAFGGLGAVAVTTVFESIARLGAGVAGALAATSGLFTVVFTPSILGQRPGVHAWIGVVLGVVGVLLLSPLRLGGPAADAGLGWVAGVVSGAASGLAYLVAARLRGRRSPLTLMMHWTVVCVGAHVIGFVAVTPQFPTTLLGWILVAGAGAAAATSQLWTMKAYQFGPAAGVAVLGYAAPVLGVAADLLWFDAVLTKRGAAGVSLICAGGLVAILGASNCRFFQSIRRGTREIAGHNLPES